MVWHSLAFRKRNRRSVHEAKWPKPIGAFSHANILPKHLVLCFLAENCVLHLEFDICAFLLLLYLDWGQLLYGQQCICLSRSDGQPWKSARSTQCARSPHSSGSSECTPNGDDFRTAAPFTKRREKSVNISSAQCIILLHICIHQILSTDKMRLL